MLLFSPASSRLWQKVIFRIFYSSLPIVVTRAVTFVCLSLIALLTFSSGNARIGYFTSSLLIIFLMFELFFRYKISRQFPSLTVEELAANSNLADTVTLNLATALLKAAFNNSTKNLLNSLVKTNEGNFIFNKISFTKTDLETVGEEKINLNEIVELASNFAAKEGDKFVGIVHFTIALLVNSPALKKITFEKELKSEDLLNIAHWTKNYFAENSKEHFWNRPVSTLGLGLATLWMGGWTLETERYTRDLNLTVLSGPKHYLVGRDKEVKEVEEVLVRSKKRNVILLGEPGLGKTTIVYSLVEKSFLGELPEELKFKRFMELDLAAMLASAREGEIEQRLKNILVETSHAGDVVLFIPAIENIAGGLGKEKFDLTGILENEIVDINLQIIGTSSRSSYHEFIERKPIFSNNFEIIDVAEPDRDQAIRIAEEAAVQIERKHAVILTYKALQTAVELSEKYMVDRVLPGKAIDILDEAAASCALAKNPLVEKSDVEQVITEKTNVPASLAKGEEKEKLLELEKILHARIVGQDQALTSVSEAVRRARTINRDSHRPIGVFLFLGPTGVGKTETAKALAQVYYGSEERIIRVDMSEYNQENSVFRLIGAGPGQSEFEKGGQLTEKVRANPFSLVLLDELEKAHPKVQELFLAIFDEGRIEDSSGRLISFSNTIIIGTSNASAEFIREEIQKQTPIEALKRQLTEKLLRDGLFKPEFLNRFDAVVVYQPLQSGEVNSIINLMLKELTARLAKQDLEISVSPEVVNFLATKGYDPQFGARPLRRVIQDEIEGAISKALLEEKIGRGSKVQLQLVNNQISVIPIQ